MFSSPPFCGNLTTTRAKESAILPLVKTEHGYHRLPPPSNKTRTYTQIEVIGFAVTFGKVAVINAIHECRQFNPRKSTLKNMFPSGGQKYSRKQVTDLLKHHGDVGSTSSNEQRDLHFQFTSHHLSSVPVNQSYSNKSFNIGRQPFQNITNSICPGRRRSRHRRQSGPVDYLQSIEPQQSPTKLLTAKKRSLSAKSRRGSKKFDTLHCLEQSSNPPSGAQKQCRFQSIGRPLSTPTSEARKQSHLTKSSLRNVQSSEPHLSSQSLRAREDMSRRLSAKSVQKTRNTHASTVRAKSESVESDGQKQGTAKSNDGRDVAQHNSCTFGSEPAALSRKRKFNSLEDMTTEDLSTLFEDSSCSDIADMALQGLIGHLSKMEGLPDIRLETIAQLILAKLLEQ